MMRLDSCVQVEAAMYWIVGKAGESIFCWFLDVILSPIKVIGHFYWLLSWYNIAILIDSSV